jgi:hypothetical protein
MKSHCALPAGRQVPRNIQFLKTASIFYDKKSRLTRSGLFPQNVLSCNTLNDQENKQQKSFI